jgi:site-specific recombinase XerD
LVVRGKGRRERILPLWKETTTAVRAWLALRGDLTVPELFVNRNGDALSRAGFEYILDKYVVVARRSSPSLKRKRVSPHVLRHTNAMMTLQATRDLRRVALWLGHASTRTTEIYVRADPTEKLATIESMLPPTLRSGRFRPPDRLLSLISPANMRRPKSSS